MTRKALMSACATTAIIGAAAGCASPARIGTPERADCPGKIVCPLTGELICADQCPAEKGKKADLSLGVAEPQACCNGAK